ncbi:MAG: polysaccharide biosynthesis tyrosine autokinase [Alphaproteobacteria bacterium]|nr:polysaccharide biosynthesis tyrosine autokinase [Alphaproteobacteria bacterium]
MELLSLIRALGRRRWLLVQSVVFFTVLGLVSAILLPKNYQASARVMVSSSDASSAVLSELGLQELALGMSGESEEIANHIALATSRPVLTELIRRLQLRDDEGELLEPEKVLVPGLTGGLFAEPVIEVKQQQGTDLVYFTATSNDPEQSRVMADALAEIYIAETRERARQETRAAREFVEERLGIVRGEFDSALAEIADVQQREQILDLDAELRSAVSRLSELMLAAEENVGRISELRAQMGELKGIHGQEDIDNVSPITVAENPDIRSLREVLLTLQVQREGLLLEKTELHPDVRRIDAQLRAAEEALALALDVQHELNPGLVKLRTELAGLLERGVEINAAIDRTVSRFSVYPDKMRRMAQLQLAANAAEEVYRSLQAQSYQIAVAEAMSASPMQMVEPAVAPDRQVSPKPLVNTILGGALGVLFGLALVALMEYIDDSVRSPEELGELLPYGQLGVIPKHAAGVGQSVAQLPATDPLAEAFRTLRGGLLFSSPDAALRSVVFSSSLPGEGKSTVLANLAVIFAQAGERTLVLDCDLRRPTQHRFHQATNNAKGLSQVLLGGVSLEEAIQDTGVQNLSLLAAGATPPDPGRLVESERLATLLESLKGRYDRVLIDAPPALVVQDALTLATRADGLVLVVEAGATSRRVLGDLERRLAERKLQPLGLVLNKMNYNQAGYGVYAKAYKSYAPETPS